MHPRPTYPASRTPLPKTEARLPSAPSKLHLASTRGISVATTINIGSFDDCKTILNSLTGTCSGLFPGGIFTVNKKTFGTFRSGCIHLYGTRTIFSSTIAVNSLALILCDTEASRKLSCEIRTGQRDGGRSRTTDRGLLVVSRDNESSALFSLEFVFSAPACATSPRPKMTLTEMNSNHARDVLNVHGLPTATQIQ